MMMKKHERRKVHLLVNIQCRLTGANLESQLPKVIFMSLVLFI